MPSSPDDNAVPKTARRSKRVFEEAKSPSSPKTASAPERSHNAHDRSPSPGFRPVTVKKKRKTQAEVPEEEEKTMKIALPFADTPIIKRNKEMRKASADTNRRSSSGMRGRRASSLIDEGRGNGKFCAYQIIIAALGAEFDVWKQCCQAALRLVLGKVVLTVLFLLQQFHTLKCPPQNSTSISLRNSQNHAE